MGDDNSGDGKPVGQIFLGGLGVLLLGVGVWGYVGDADDKIAGGFLVAALLLIVLSAFYSRIEGIVELGSLKIPIGKARRAEKQVEQGRVVSPDKLEGAWNAMEEALARYNIPSQVGTPTITQSPPPQETAQEGSNRWSRGRNVQLVDDAVVTMASLPSSERVQVQAEIARMSTPEFREEDDPKAIRSGDQGRSYRVHKVPDSDLRLWYRPLNENHPETLVVMVIQRKGERI